VFLSVFLKIAKKEHAQSLAGSPLQISHIL